MSDDYVVGIDPGTRNMGVCVMTMDGVITQLNRVDLLALHTTSCIDAIRQWCTANAQLLSNAKCVVVEKQFVGGVGRHIKCAESLIIVETVICTLFPANTVQVKPMTIKAFHGLKPTGNHALNKACAIEKVKSTYAGVSSLFSGKKVDDVCDAVLLGRYGIHFIGLTADPQ